MTEMLDRINCVICSSSSMEPLVSFKSYPMFMGISKNPSEDLSFDQDWSICSECGCVQLKKLVPLEKLYERGHNPSIGSTWEKHHRDFADFISKYSGTSMLELGGGNCVLFDNLKTLVDFDSYVIYDKRCQGQDPRLIKKDKFYEPFVVDDVGIDTIIHSHTMEHFYDPRDFVKSFNDLLDVGGRVILSVPDTKRLVNDKLNGVNFEHTYFLCMEYLNHIMSTFGFELIESANFNEYNIFACYEKKTKEVSDIDLVNQYRENKKIMEDYVESNLKDIEKYNEILKDKKNKYLFGCHVTTQNLIKFGLDLDGVVGLLDNDPGKQNNFLYGTGMMTFSPEVLREEKQACVLVQRGIYTDEIVKGLKLINDNLNIVL